MNRIATIAVALLGLVPVTALTQESPDRVDRPMDSSTPIHDRDTRGTKTRMLVQTGGDALVSELREPMRSGWLACFGINKMEGKANWCCA